MRWFGKSRRGRRCLNGYSKNSMTRRKQTENTGSVLIVTILITSVLFGIGTAFASILEKEVARQVYEDRSQKAINIANTALECALYNDFRRHAFNALVESDSTVLCGDLYQVRTVSNWNNPYYPSTDHGTVAGTGTYEFAIIESQNVNLSGVSGVPCAHTILQRRCVGSTSGTSCISEVIDSSIEVRGYDRCSSGDENQRDIVRRFKVYY